MKVLVIYLPFLVATGLGLTVAYFSLAKLFAANARALDRNRKALEQMARQTEKTQPPQTKDELEAIQKGGIKTAAKAGK